MVLLFDFALGFVLLLQFVLPLIFFGFFPGFLSFSCSRFAAYFVLAFGLSRFAVSCSFSFVVVFAFAFVLGFS